MVIISCAASLGTLRLWNIIGSYKSTKHNARKCIYKIWKIYAKRSIYSNRTVIIINIASENTLYNNNENDNKPPARINFSSGQETTLSFGVAYNVASYVYNIMYSYI